MKKYNRLVGRLGELLLRTGLTEWKQKGHISKDVLLVLAQVNMPMSRPRLRKVCPSALDLFFEDALNDLVDLSVVWCCSSCPASQICEAKPPDEHYCLVEGPHVLENLKKGELRNLSQEEESEFTNILRTVSHHGVESVEEVPGTWSTIKDGRVPYADEREFVRVPDTEVQAWGGNMLLRATKSIRIASEYGGWVAKEPFRSMITSKIKNGVEVTLVVNAPPALGTNGRLEWNEWNTRHRRMGLSPIKRVQPDWKKGGTSLNMTIVEGSRGKEVLFFERDRYGLTLAGTMYSNYPTRVKFYEKKFEEYTKMTRLKERVRRWMKPERFVELIAGTGSATVGGLLGGVAGAVIGFLVGFSLPYLIRKIQKCIVE